MPELTGKYLKLIFNEKDFSVTLNNFRNGTEFSQENDKNIKPINFFNANNKIYFSFFYSHVLLNGVYEIKTDETGEYAQLSLSSNAEFTDNIAFPPAFSVCRGDRAIEAYCEGLSFPVEDDIPFPQKRPLYGGTWNSMSFWGIARSDNSWLLCAVIDNFDASLLTVKNEDSLYTTRVLWEPQKGVWGSVRKMRFYLGDTSPIVSISEVYRGIAVQKGLVRTLRQKAADNPLIDKLAGSADIWLWNSDSMDKLYSEKSEYTPTSEEQFALRRRIASEMKASGMENVLWCVFDEQIDPETVQHVKSLGYITAYYDVYTDVIPKDHADKMTGVRLKRCEHRIPYWPDGIVIERDGSLAPAWEIKGTDGKFYAQNRMCDRIALKCAEKYVLEHGKKNGMDGVFIDVAVCNTKECYSKEHPLNRQQAFMYKNRLFEMINGMGMFCGTENGHEDAVRSYAYSEGIMSPCEYRAEDSGRRMTRLYEKSEMGSGFLDYMLNPKYRIPLWELVYHDCQTSYWYWGDSSNSCPELMKCRDLFNILYGQPPLYSFCVDDWQTLKCGIADSYHRTVPSARKLRYARMVSFEILTNDYTVQKTVFDDGTQIIVNFGEQEYSSKEVSIGPKNYKII